MLLEGFPTESRQRIRLLFVSRTFPPKLGGMENYLYALNGSLRKATDLRTVILKLNRYLAIPAAPIFVIAIMLKSLRWKPDVIYFSDVLLAPASRIVSKMLGCPSVTTVYGLDLTHRNPVYLAYVTKALHWFSFLIAISSSTLSLALARGAKAESIKVITPGASFKSINQTSAIKFDARVQKQGVTTLLSVGRLIKRKGVYWFIDNVMPRLKELMPNLLYLVVGTGPDYTKVDNLIQSRGLKDSVRLLGCIDDLDLHNLYSSANAFIMPNIPVQGDVEGFGLVIAEATLQGVPVVASRLQGIADAVVEGKTGLLARALDVDDFVRKIVTVLGPAWQNADQRHEIARTTKVIYSWHKVATNYVAVMKTLLKR